MLRSSTVRRGFAALMLLCCLGLHSLQAQRSRLTLSNGATCPIQITALDITGGSLRFAFRNRADKDIQGIRFGAAYYDSVQDPHQIAVLGGDDKVLRSGHRRDASINVHWWKNTGNAGWTIWPAKILYTDGSYWEMGEGRTACSAARWVDKQLHPPILPSAVLLTTPELIPEHHGNN